MIKILINAYACSPNMGSEPGMAWNWCVNLAKYCELHIITEGEFKSNIDAILPALPQAKNMHFYYNPVSDKVRKMCWNQGDWRFYFYYKQWQKKTYYIACNIIKKEKIDIIHQLNMVGFREPGYLWRINNIPFVWGPIGGMENIPLNYIENEGYRKKMFVTVKRVINDFQIRHKYRVRRAIENSRIILGATKSSIEKIDKYYNKEVILLNETACNQSSQYQKKEKESDFNIIWVGRFLFTKKLDLALKTIAELKSLKGLKFHIVGSGSSDELIKYRKLAQELDIENICIWHGFISNIEVQSLMRKCQMFFFTSVMEATSTVVMEAISNNLPIVCFDICGFGPIIDDGIGRKIDLSTPHDSVLQFANIIKDLYYNVNKLEEMSDNCIMKANELSWENKAKQMFEIYKQLV